MCEDNRNGKKENRQSKDVFDVIRTVHFVDRLYANHYIENGELIIRDIFDEGTFCKKITRDFTETADPTSAIISITLEKEGQFVIEYYKGVMTGLMSIHFHLKTTMGDGIIV